MPSASSNIPDLADHDLQRNILINQTAVLLKGTIYYKLVGKKSLNKRRPELCMYKNLFLDCTKQQSS